MNGDGHDMKDDGTRDETGEDQPEAPTSEVHLGPPAASPKTRKMRVGLLLGALIGLIIIGGGAAAAVLLTLRGTGDTILDKVPSDSIVYATAYLDPAAGQKLNLENLLGKFPALDKDKLGEQFSGFMDDVLGAWHLSFDKDVKPWLGTQVSVVVTDNGSEPGAALLIASKDDAAAGAALGAVQDSPGFPPGTKWNAEEYKGTTITSGYFDMAGISMGQTKPVLVYAVTDGTAILASSVDTAKKIVDTAKGDLESLAGNEDYVDTMASLPKERLAELFVNGPALVRLIARTADFTSMPTAGPDPLQSLEALRGIGMSMDAESNGLAMKMTSLIDRTKMPAEAGAGATPHQNEVLSWTPEDAYGVVGGVSLGEALDQTLNTVDQIAPDFRNQADQFGVSEAIDALSGDFGFVVSPGAGPYPSGAFLMGTKDAAAMQAFLDKVSELASSALASGLRGSAHASAKPSIPGTQSIKIGVMPPSWEAENYKGTAISYLPLPDKGATEAGIEPAYAVSNGMTLIAASPDEIKKLMDAHSGQNILSSANYMEAIAQADAENTGIMYVDLENIFAGIASATGTKIGTGLNEQLAPLKAVVMTSGGTSESSTATIFILIK